jgi:hypothetical protein
MSENALTIITPKTLSEAKELSAMLAGARTIPEALQKSPADVMAIVMAGAELGLAPMQAIRALVLIKGKPTLSADAMGALVKSRRDVCQYLVVKHSDGQRATYETQRVGDPTPTTMGFTIEEARAANLTGDNWKRFPAAMLRARALSAICRAVYPDLLLGVYDPDELAPEPRDVTPRPTPPNVIDSTAVIESSERTALEAAVATANNEAELTALVERITRLAASDKAKVRAAWGARRDELRNAALAMAAVVPEQTEAVPS